MKNGDKPIRNPYVVLREEFDDWAVLFNPNATQGFDGFGLNPTGVYLWKLLDGERTLNELGEKLRDRAKNVTERVTDHIRALLTHWSWKGLPRTLIRGSAGEKILLDRTRQSHSPTSRRNWLI